jgi:Domain of unknown function (DUF1995)
MAELPKTLEDAIAQSTQATKAAIAAGYTRLCVELVFPELKAMAIAQQFIPTFEGMQLKVFFPDTGAAALARRDWGEVPFKIEDIGTGRTPIQDKISPEDEVFLLIEPSAVEVAEVEKLCNAAQDRPVVLLLPRLEDAAVVGIGYAARQLRQRFISTLESCYYIRPLQSAALFRCYPSPWQVYLETNDDYTLLAELAKKPVGEQLDQIIFGATASTSSEDSNVNSNDAPKPQKPGVFTSLQRFLRALSN